MDAPVTSFRNERIRRVKRLVADAGARREEGLCVVEGLRVVADCLDARLPVELAVISPRLRSLAGGPALEERLRASVVDAERILLATDEVLASASDNPAPQGVILVVPRPLAPA